MLIVRGKILDIEMKIKFTDKHTHYYLAFDGNGASYNVKSRYVEILDDNKPIEFPKDDDGKIIYEQ